MNPADIVEGLRLCRAAGWNQLEEDWTVFTKVHLGRKEDRVVATAAHIRYDNLAWIAMMLVDPAERRTGLGGKLLVQAIESAQGAPSIGLDATPLGEPLYRRFDFVPHYTLARTKATIDPTRFPGSTARPIQPADLPAIFERDREVFGADRSFLLSQIYARAPECAWTLDGAYCFGRPGYLYSQLGPIVADDFATARTLTASALSQLGGRTFAIDVTLFDSGWLEWLKSTGFVEERPFTRMFLRGHVHPGTPERQYAICGPEFA